MDPKIEPSYEQIAERALFLWQQKGCHPEQQDECWFQAEAELKKGVRKDRYEETQ